MQHLINLSHLPTALPHLPTALPHLPTALLDYLRDPEKLLWMLLDQYGAGLLWMVALIVFIESGVLFPVLPGDSLLFTLGLLHLDMKLNLVFACTVLSLAAIAGSQVGYGLGRFFGAALFSDDARILKTQYLEQAQEFFTKYGGRAVILARFVPFVRTFTPIAAGMARYDYRRFLAWNAAGALIWAGGLTWAGSLLGGVSWIRGNIELIAVIIVFVSILPMIVEVTRKWLAKRHAQGE